MTLLLFIIRMIIAVVLQESHGALRLLAHFVRSFALAAAAATCMYTSLTSVQIYFPPKSH